MKFRHCNFCICLIFFSRFCFNCFFFNRLYSLRCDYDTCCLRNTFCNIIIYFFCSFIESCRKVWIVVYQNAYDLVIVVRNNGINDSSIFCHCASVRNINTIYNYSCAAVCNKVYFIFSDSLRWLFYFRFFCCRRLRFSNWLLRKLSVCNQNFLILGHCRDLVEAFCVFAKLCAVCFKSNSLYFESLCCCNGKFKFLVFLYFFVIGSNICRSSLAFYLNCSMSCRISCEGHMPGCCRCFFL